MNFNRDRDVLPRGAGLKHRTSLKKLWDEAATPAIFPLRLK